MTTRERLERKLERREQWAQSRERKAAALFDRADLSEAKSGIPFGQPILVGHHSESRHRRAIERAHNAMDRACESFDMAKHHAAKAEGLADQLAGSIYSDDPDAVEALQARLADLEAERERIKAYNASARKAAKAGEKFGNLDILNDSEKKDLAVSLRCMSRDPENAVGVRFPSYKLSNLSANIKRNRDRLEQVKRAQTRTAAAENSDNGVVIEGREWVAITFAEKPARETLNALKAAGFSWRRPSWVGKRENIPEGIRSG